ANIIITAENGITRTYTVTINRAAVTGHSTKLESLAIAEYPNFIRNFDSDTLNYSLVVSAKTYDLNITAVPFDDEATATIEGDHNLGVDGGTITITVTHTGQSPTTYTITYTREKSNKTSGYGCTGNVQTYTAPYSGKFKIEAWGAQGGQGANKSTAYA
ncbi:cadherin-like beta sandwich domain-containing protein, partial [Ralstonia pseudosolanacearum]|uniref:cadherin-like beta sandwich domain-containing protein n=1 Tax=Ralstonia pseudosolanacearum TaxID=1310165 RepID=UPI003D183E4E